MKKIGIVVKPVWKAEKKADELEKWLKEKGADVVRMETIPPDDGPSQHPSGKDINTECPDLFCVFVLGGDGTFLSAVRWIGTKDIPIMGVKFGEVGFLAEIVEENLFAAAELILSNHFQTGTRMRLQVLVARNGNEIANETVLNDITINRGALARLVDLKTYINDYELTTFRADGLIVATPTGSTAYSLAAGGPIIHPDVSGIILTPICPFTLTNRPMIVPDTVEIKIAQEKQATDIILTFDGQKGLEINHEDIITVTKSPYPIRMITLPGQQYFDVVKTKLRWSGGRF